MTLLPRSKEGSAEPEHSKLHRMRDTGAKYGIASLCIGQGQGIATVFEAC